MVDHREVEKMAWRFKAISETNAIHDMQSALVNIEQQHANVSGMIAAAKQVRDLALTKAGVSLVEVEAEVTRMRMNAATGVVQPGAAPPQPQPPVTKHPPIHVMIDQVLANGRDYTAAEIVTEIATRWQRKVGAKTVGTILSAHAERMRWMKGDARGKFSTWRRSA